MKIKQNLSEPLVYRYIVIGVYAKKIKLQISNLVYFKGLEKQK